MINIDHTFAAETISFIALIGVTYKYIWPNINAILEARREYVEFQIKSAADSNKLSQQEFKKLEEDRKVNEQIANKLIKDTMSKIAELKKEMNAMKILQVEQNLSLLEKNKLDYQSKMRSEIREEVILHCQSVVEQTLNRTLTESEQQKLIDDIIEKL
jgi:F0F1-type ATP synthase membrane subunit b/b'